MSAGGFLVDYRRAARGRPHRATDDRQSAKLNSLNSALMREIVERMAEVAADPELRLAILLGAGGRAFVGGADVGEIAALDHASARAFITLVHQLLRGVSPLAGAGHRPHRRLGVGRRARARRRLRPARRQRRFAPLACPRSRSASPRWSRRRCCRKLIGEGRARRLLLTGETIGAAEALEWGLVDIVAPAEALDAAVERLARPILAAGPRAIRLQKSLILDWEELPAEAAIARGIDAFVSAFDSDEPARMAGAALARLRARRQARSTAGRR